MLASADRTIPGVDVARMRIIGTARSVVLPATIGLALVLGGCQGDQKGGTGTTAPTTASPTASVTASPVPLVTTTPEIAATAPPTSTDEPLSPYAEIVAAVKREPALATDAAVTAVAVSTIDPTWATAATDSPTAGGARVLLHQTSGVWKVTSLGSADIGCDDGTPRAILTEFHLECPE